MGTRRGEEVRGRNSVRPGDRCAWWSVSVVKLYKSQAGAQML